jgi:hypothetical protein
MTPGAALLCSANDISAICSIPTKNITTKLVRTYRCTRTRRSRVLFRLSVARWRCRFWADCTINISEHKFPTRTGVKIFERCFPPIGATDTRTFGLARQRKMRKPIDSGFLIFLRCPLQFTSLVTSPLSAENLLRVMLERRPAGERPDVAGHGKDRRRVVRPAIVQIANKHDY